MGLFTQKDQLTEHDTNRGLRLLVFEGVCSQVMTILSSGVFLVAMALALGANNFVIGLLAAIGPLSQVLQLPAIFLVEKVARRKILVVLFSFAGRASLPAIAVLPFLPLDNTWRIPLFILLLFAFFGLGAISGCSFNSWMKDFVPETAYGTFFGKRLAVATAAGAVASVGAGLGADWLEGVLESETAPYSIYFGVAGFLGVLGTLTLSAVPEPFPAPSIKISLKDRLLEPLRDKNFRRLLVFTSSWNFSIIMGGAFFAVYMLTRIGIPLTYVVLLSVLSQVTNVFFYKIWGNISDQFSNKSVLGVASPLFVLMLLMYPFTTMPDAYFLTIPLLIIIHILGGISTAGFTLCTANIAMKLAPRGKAAAYLATNALVSGLAAVAGPIVGGLLGRYFDGRQLSLGLSYTTDRTNPEVGEVVLPAFYLEGLDFVFVLAAVAGVYAVHRLSLVDEVGTVDEKRVREEVFTSVRQTFSTLSNVAGVRRITYFPYEVLKFKKRTAGTPAVKKALTDKKDKKPPEDPVALPPN